MLALPEDMLAAEVDVAGRASRSTSCSRIRAREQIESLRGLLERAERPFVAARRRRLDAARVAQDMRAFVEANELPAGAAFRRQDAIDNDSPSYVGDVGIGINPKLAARVRDADLLLVVGPRLGEMTTSGYTLDRAKQTLVHVHPGAEELGRVYRPALPILSGMEQFAGGGARPSRRAALARVDRARRAPTTRRGSSPSRCRARSTSATCIAHLRERVPDAIVTNGAGNFTRLGAPLLALPRLPDPARADERRDGLRRAGGGRREARRARSAR